MGRQNKNAIVPRTEKSLIHYLVKEIKPCQLSYMVIKYVLSKVIAHSSLRPFKSWTVASFPEILK